MTINYRTCHNLLVVKVDKILVMFNKMLDVFTKIWLL